MRVRRNYYIPFLLLMALTVLCVNVNAQSKGSGKQDQAIVSVDILDDAWFLEKFTEGAMKLHESQECTSLEDLTEQLSKSTEAVKVNHLFEGEANNEYSDIKKSVLVVGLIFKPNEFAPVTPNVASAFVISDDGVCVTNHHIFSVMAKPQAGSFLMAAMDDQGNVFPIEKILSSSEADDLAIFKIDAGDIKLHPLKLSDHSAKVGEDVSLISHPMQRFYHYSEGCVTRYYYDFHCKTPRLSTDVDFAQGSSGAPFFNKNGEVVGIVSSTLPFVAREQMMLQMTVYEAIPVSSLKRLIK